MMIGKASIDMKEFQKKTGFAAVLIAAIALTGCDKGGESAASGGENAGDTISEAVNSAAESVESAAGAVANKAEETVASVKEAAESATAPSSSKTESGSDKGKFPPLPASLPSKADLDKVKTDVSKAAKDMVDEVKKQLEVVHVQAKEAAELLIDNPDVVVLDLRTPAETSKGMIPSAINLDFRNPEFAENLKKLSTDKKYLIHCQSGGRSTSALSTFKALGFDTVYHLDGGYSGWEKAGLDTTTPNK
jgi:rhodanese-related sulfurtransferase